MIVEEYHKIINIEISKQVDIIKKSTCAKSVVEAMEYSLLSGGKRLRPILMMMVADSLKLDRRKSLPFAIAVEFVHTYSLIHDDLPAMDDDNLRRGVPTCHIKYGENIAILAGDALLNYAYELLIKAGLEKHNCYNLRCFLKAVKLFSDYSGISGLIDGQAIDISALDSESTYEDYLVCFKLKTGKLISLCFEIPAILSGLNTVDYIDIKELGEKFGICYQLKDNLIDYDDSKVDSDKLFRNVISKNDLQLHINKTYYDIEKLAYKCQLNGNVLNFINYLIMGR